jgi:hypothetical protein
VIPTSPFNRGSPLPGSHHRRSNDPDRSPYLPRRVFLPYHHRKQRWANIVAHGRCGKTVACINDDIAACLRSDHWRTREPLENFRAGYIAPLLKQARPSPGTTSSNTHCRSRAWSSTKPSFVRISQMGTRYRLFGADNLSALRGLRWDRVTEDEPAQMRHGFHKTVVLPAWLTGRGRPPRSGRLRASTRSCSQSCSRTRLRMVISLISTRTISFMAAVYHGPSLRQYRRGIAREVRKGLGCRIPKGKTRWRDSMSEQALYRRATGSSSRSRLRSTGNITEAPRPGRRNTAAIRIS